MAVAVFAKRLVVHAMTFDVVTDTLRANEMRQANVASAMLVELDGVIVASSLADKAGSLAVFTDEAQSG